MTNSIAIVLAALIVGMFVLDATVLHLGLPVMLGRLVAQFIEWVSFWRRRLPGFKRDVGLCAACAAATGHAIANGAGSERPALRLQLKATPRGCFLFGGALLKGAPHRESQVVRGPV